MAVDVAAYAKELMQEAGIPADQQKQFETLFSNPKVQAKLGGTLEGIEREKGRAAAAEKSKNDYYAEQLRIAANNKKVVEDTQAQLQAYVDRFGELPGGGDAGDPNARRQALADAIDKKTFSEELKKRDGLTVGLIKGVNKITATHLKEFQEVPDFDAIEKIAMEKGMNAEQAYQEWSKPKYDERANKALEEKLKLAREEGFREGASKSANPVDAGQKQTSAFVSNMRKKESTATTPSEAFNQAWNEWKPGQKPQGF